MANRSAPHSAHAVRRQVVAICRRLERQYGRVEPPPQEPVLDELIATILSQNTSAANAQRAYGALLRALPTWEAVRTAPVRKVARAIKMAGLYNRKAPRIQAILNRLKAEQGRLSLEFLRRAPLAEAKHYLRSFDGVGPKTVGCVLLFACRRPVLPVDTHVHRISIRLGLIDRKTDAETAHDLLAEMVPIERVLDFHILLIRHGRTMCKARAMQCPDCPLLDLCPTGARQLLADEGLVRFDQ